MNQPTLGASPTHSPTLQDAWFKFGEYDKNATLAQKRFVYRHQLINILGVGSTVLVVKPRPSSDLEFLRPQMYTIASPFAVHVFYAHGEYSGLAANPRYAQRLRLKVGSPSHPRAVYGTV